MLNETNILKDNNSENESLSLLFKLLVKRFGTDFSHYRKSTVLRRIDRRVSMLRIKNYQEYINILKSDTKELDKLYHDLLLSFTEFFRDNHIFNALSDKLYPVLLDSQKTNREIRIWVPGCSTGQEVYSIAICVDEYVKHHNLDFTIQIFGTDILEANINFARKALYPEKIEEQISQERLARYFKKSEHGYQVVHSIREMCIFALQDFVNDPPFLNIDFLSCRNVLIYFDDVFLENAIPVFHYALKSSGYLLLGSSENLNNFQEYFAIVDSKINLFRKLQTSNSLLKSFSDLNLKPVNTKVKPSPDHTMINDNNSHEELIDNMNEILLENYTSPGVLVDSKLNIIRFVGQLPPFINHHSGKASLNLVDLVSDGLLPDIYLLIEETKKYKKTSQKTNISYSHKNSSFLINISVSPVSPDKNSSPYFLLIFEYSYDETENTTGISAPKNEAEEIRQLKEELKTTKQHLQTIINEKDKVNQELWASNQEVQSANEELRSMNEEMEAAKEELESSNEELLTLNEVLKNKNDELNNSLNFNKKLFDTASAIIVTLDSQGNIQTFNNYAEEKTGFKNEEVIGRNWFSLFIPTHEIGDISDVFDEIINNIDEHRYYENEIIAKSGKRLKINWSNSILYDNNNNATGILSIGADVTEKRQVETDLIDNARRWRLAQDVAEIGNWEYDLAKNQYWLSEKAILILGLALDDTSDQEIDEEIILAQLDNTEALKNARLNLVLNNKPYFIEHNISKANGDDKIILSQAICLYDNKNNPIKLSGTLQDITKQKEIEKTLAKQKQRLNDILIGTNAGTWEWNIETGEIIINEKWAHIIGYKLSELLPTNIDTWIKFTHPDDLSNSDSLLKKHFSGETDYYECEARMKHKNGEWIWILDRGQVNSWNEDGAPLWMSGTHQDITRQKRLQYDRIEALSRLQLFIDASPDLCFLKDNDLRYLMINKANADFFGLAPEEILGKTDLELMGEEMAAKCKISDMQTLETGKEVNVLEEIEDGVYETRKVPIITDNEVTGLAGFVRDITHQVKLEKDYRTVFNEMLDGFAIHEMIFDEDGEPVDYRFIDINPAFTKLTGTTRYVIGKTVLELMPNTEKFWIETYGRIVKTGIPEIFENYAQALDKHFEVTAYRHAPGQFACIFSDITHRRRSEAEIRKFRTISDESLTGHVISDLEGKLLYINKFMANIHGYEPEDIIGKNFNIFHDENDFEDVQLTVDCIKNTGSFNSTVLWHIHKDGSRFPMMMNGVLLKDERDEPAMMAASAIDMTNVYAAEDALRESEERFQHAMSASNDGLFDWLLGTDTIYYSPGWKRLLGYEDDELENSFQIWEDLTHPDDVKESYKRLEAHLEGQTDRFEMEFRMMHKDGHWVDILSRAHVVQDKDGKPYRMIGTHVDISHIKFEQKLQAAQLNLINYSTKLNATDVLQKFLDEAEALTESEIGFYHFIDEGQDTVTLKAWSTNTVNTICKTGEINEIYPLAESGIWTECIKERQPKIYNNYNACANSNGLPEGHAPLIRFMTAPVIRDEKVLAILGVGNKPFNYSEQDVSTIQKLANLALEIVIRKETEEALIESERKLKESHELAHLGSWYWEVESGEVSWSDEVYKIFGFDKDTFTPQIDSIMSLSPFPGESERHQELINKAIESRQPGEYEQKFIHASGSIGYYASTFLGVYDKSGKLTAIKGTVLDITERKSAELALRESEQKFRSYVENAPFGIFISDENGNYIEVNKMACEITGYSESELVGTNISELIYSDDKEIAKEHFISVTLGDSQSIELRFKHKTGAVKYWLVDAVKLSEKRFLGFTTEVTDKIIANNQIKYERDKAKMYLDIADVIMVALDIEGNVTMINQKGLNLLGLPMKEVIGYNWFKKFMPDYLYEEAIGNYRKLLSGSRPEQMNYSGKIISLENDIRIIDWHHALLRDENGKVTGTLSSGEDITEKKLHQRLLETRLSIIEYASNHTLDELLIWVLDQISILVNSPIGFYHYVSQDQKTIHLQQWSSATTKSFCHIEGQKMQYDIEDAGVWAEAILKKEAIIHNDYSSLENKKGMPEGHAEVIRELVVPVIRNNIVVAILGVGNKPGNYTEKDVESVTYIADVTWELVRNKKADAQLRDTQEFLSTAISQSPAGIIIADAPDVTIRMANQAAFNLRGDSSELLTDINVKHHSKLWKTHTQDDEEYPTEQLPLSRAVLKGEYTYNEELIIYNKKGEKRWVITNAAPIKDTQGNITSGIVIYQDITEMKEADLKYKRSQEMLNNVMNTIPVRVFWKDLNSVYLGCNMLFAKDAGVNSPEEIRGKTDYDLFVSDVAERYQKDDAKVMNTGQAHINYDEPQQNENSEIRWLRTSKVPIIDDTGNVYGILGTYEDITEKKNAIDALSESEEKYKSIFNNSAIGIGVRALDNTYVKFNDYYQKMLAYPEEELFTKKTKDITHPEDIHISETNFQAVASGKSDFRQYQKRYIRKDGEIVWAEVSIQAIKDSKGNITSIAGVIANITKRIKAEQELQKIAKLESLGILAGGIAHNFKNILASMALSVELAMIKPEKVKEQLNKLLLSIDQATALATKFQTFTKSDAPMLKPQNINNIIREAADIALSGSSSIVRFNLDQETPKCLVDSKQMNEVFMNLLINSDQAMPRGGNIYITTSSSYISDTEIVNLSRGNYVKVEIRDEGVGIPRSQFAEIFTPFFTTKAKGHGLGLASVYYIIQKHSGSISVDSEIEKGTEFTIYLPATETINESEEKFENMFEGYDNAIKVMMVDDDQNIIEIMSELSEFLENIELVCYNNPYEALDYYKRLAPDSKVDVVILDLTLVGYDIDGSELLAQLRDIDPDVKALVFSGHSARPIVAKYEDYGFNGRLEKPCTLNRFKEAVLKLMLPEQDNSAD